MGDRPGRPHRRQQLVAVVLAPELERRRALEGAEDRPQRLDVLPEPWSRVLELARVAALDVGTDLGADAEQEATVGQVGELPRRRRRHHRAAREGDGDAGAVRELGRGEGRRGHREVGRAAGLGERDPGEPAIPGLGRQLLHLAQRTSVGHHVDEHRCIVAHRHPRLARPAPSSLAALDHEFRGGTWMAPSCLVT